MSLKPIRMVNIQRDIKKQLKQADSNVKATGPAPTIMRKHDTELAEERAAKPLVAPKEKKITSKKTAPKTNKVSKSTAKKAPMKVNKNFLKVIRSAGNPFYFPNRNIRR